MVVKRRSFLGTMGKATIGLAGVGPLYSLLQGCTPQNKMWNIVFIVADDLGWNQVAYHGFDFYETPNIDRIAAEGMHFSDAYSASPVCSPTRASMMTGKNPARLHLTDYIPGSPYPYQKLTTPQQAECLPLEEVTIAELLKKNGYITGHFGKWHLSPDKNYQPGRPFDPGSQGFDDIYTSVKPKPDDPPDDAHHTEAITKHSLNFLEKNKDRPFFLYVSYHAVHRPLIEKQELIAKYEAKPGSERPENNPITGAMIERMDTGIGRILDKLDDLKLFKNTVVVFYSDNGGFEALQDQYPLRGGKAMIFEGGIRVPLAVRWPGVVKPGTKSSVPVTSDDFFPSFAAIAGIEHHVQDIDGKNLLPLLKQTGSIARDALYWHYPHYHHLGYKPASAIRAGDYKLIEWHEEMLLDLENQVNLYNLRDDIGENHDLSKEMPEKVSELRVKLSQWRRAVDAQEMVVNPKYEPQKAEWRFVEG